MSYKALYRTYRPTSFEEVVGQKHIVTTLMNAVKQNKMAHAYLLCGPRGTGKTTVARLLAKAVNCEHTEAAPCNNCDNCKSSDLGTHQDIVEIDAASSSGVDQIRDLIEKVKYSPIQGRFKVYIIDEVHMLSQGAFNALLKTLEEPPAHVIFILATTEPYKVLPTIISRCQRYDFSKVGHEEIVSRLKYVADLEKINIEDEALRLVAILSDGGMRDALSIFDQCIAYAQNEITVEDVNDIYGITTIQEKISMIEDVFSKNAKSLLNVIQTLSEKGIDIRRLTNDLIEILKEAVIYSYTKDSGLLHNLNVNEVEKILENKNSKILLRMVDILMEATVSYKSATNVSSYFEVAVLKMMAIVDEKEQVQIIHKEEVKEVVAPIINASPVTPEVVIEEESIEITEPVKEEVIEKPKKEKNEPDQILSTEFILSLLVSANKETKENDKNSWNQLENKSRDLSCAKCATILKSTMIVASGEDFVVVTSDTTAEANQINDLQLNQELHFFIKEQLELDKMIYAVGKENFIEITQEFKERMSRNDLPPSAQITKYKKVVTKEKKKTTEEKLIDLFGQENIDIIEEE
ncbi:MAG: DNA polymerase III subunit gamma/tau [Anaerorhabdus sp.]|uniref:DNA polymerase III subunit gamma/tau n=1 Tax=Anaerorhabdus sp. TaxID=1872524 RepID=UPI003A8BF535